MANTELPPLHSAAQQPSPASGEDSGMSWAEMGAILRRQGRFLSAGVLLCTVSAIAISFAVPPLYTARVVILPPQPQSASASALASLGSLGSLAGLTGGGLKSPGDQYVSLLQSTTVQNHLVDAFDLKRLYDERYQVDARKMLAKRVQVSLGKKDGLISIEVDDESPQRAAEMANRHIEELRLLNDRLAIGEAKQRRLFFEKLLKETRADLTEAQQALQASGFTPGALRAEPRAAAEEYARLRAAVTTAEVRLQGLRSGLNDAAPEVRQSEAALAALRSQLSRVEQAAGSDSTKSQDYVGRYREFKYQETLFELIARQYELARVDESREGGLIQVVDPAVPPERKSWPKRGLLGALAFVLSAMLLSAFVLMRESLRVPVQNRPGRTS